MAAKHKKPTKAARRGRVVAIGDRVKDRGLIVGWDMTNPERIIYYVRSTKK